MMEDNPGPKYSREIIQLIKHDRLDGWGYPFVI